ncbi:MAG: hypothetical protein LBT84_03960 [Spirochaetia bacterium]|jgi:hypothetical protein|nr:hypothetical protein [Spirochaetia bacterium]
MDRQVILNKATDEIIDYVKTVFIIKDIYNNINKDLNKKLDIASPYLNFRDALFHYKKMYETDDDISFTDQLACLDEHLNRGIKDFVICLCSNFYIPVLHNMLNNCSDNKKVKLRNVYHKQKNLITEIRLGGQTLQRFNNQEWLARLTTITQEIHTLLNNDSTLKQLYLMLNKEKRLCPYCGKEI